MTKKKEIEDMTKKTMIRMMFIGVLHLMFGIQEVYGQEMMMDPWTKISEIGNADLILVQASFIVQSPDGNFFEIFWKDSMEEYAVYMVDELYGSDFSLAYWGEDYVNGALEKMKEMWAEMKAYIVQILDKIREMTGLIGMILIFVCSGILTYFLNVTFPAFPSKWVFYVVFILICTGWIYLTSAYKSVIYAGGILIVPHIVIGTLAMMYRRIRGRFGNKIY